MGPRDQATAEALHQWLERIETAETAHAREIEAKPDTAYSHDLRQATIRAVITTRTRAALAAIIRHCDNLPPPHTDPDGLGRVLPRWDLS